MHSPTDDPGLPFDQTSTPDPDTAPPDPPLDQPVVIPLHDILADPDSDTPPLPEADRPHLVLVLPDETDEPAADSCLLLHPSTDDSLTHAAELDLSAETAAGPLEQAVPDSSAEADDPEPRILSVIEWAGGDVRAWRSAPPDETADTVATHPMPEPAAGPAESAPSRLVHPAANVHSEPTQHDWPLQATRADTLPDQCDQAWQAPASSFGVAAPAMAGLELAPNAGSPQVESSSDRDALLTHVGTAASVAAEPTTRDGSPGPASAEVAAHLAAVEAAAFCWWKMWRAAIATAACGMVAILILRSVLA